MPRHSADYKYIDRFFNRDRQAFNGLSKCGYMNQEHFKAFNIAKARLKNYERDGLVQKVPYKGGEAYKMTDAGRELARSNWGIDNHYRCQNPNHDLAIADKFVTLTNEQQWSCKTEEDARDRVQEIIEEKRDQGEEEVAKLYEELLENGLVSMPDLIYTNEQGIEISFEVVTNNYGPDEILCKEVASEILGTELEIQRV